MSDDALPEGSFAEQMAAVAAEIDGGSLDEPAVSHSAAEETLESEAVEETADEGEPVETDGEPEEEPDGDEQEEPEPLAAKSDGIDISKLDPKGKRALLDQLAKELKLGIAVDAGERVQFREAKRKANAELLAKEQEIAGQVRQLREQLEADHTAKKTELGAYVKAKEAHDRGDFDALAQAYGYKDFAAFSDEAVTSLADTTYQRVRAAERRVLDREQRETQEREQAAARQQQEQQQAEQAQRDQHEQRVLVNLSQSMAQSPEPVLKTLHSWPELSKAVLAVQKAEYDRLSNTTVTPEEALDVPFANGQTLRMQLAALRDGLITALGGAASANASGKPAAKAKPEPAAEVTEEPTPKPKGKASVKVTPVKDIFERKPGLRGAELAKQRQREMAYMRRELAKAKDL